MRRLVAMLALAGLLAGCAALQDLLVVRGDYGSSSGARGEIGVRF
ncbi:hypothetical protein [Stella sp.]